MPPEHVSVRTTTPPQVQATPWESPDSNDTLKTTQDRYTESITKDLNSGRMSPAVNQMADAVRLPGNKSLPQVQVKTFAVDGVQAKDIIFIERVPPTADGPNIVLYIPEKDGSSFQAFKNIGEMNTWLKSLANDPKQLQAFVQHFTQGGSPERTLRVTHTMTQFKDNDINAVVGPYANEGNDIFGRLDKGISTLASSANGLTNVREERTSADGRVLYSGQRDNGVTVLFEFDAYGNLLGEDKDKNFYFVKNGLNNNKPVAPMSASAFKNTVANEAANNVGANDIRGFYEELLNHLEHPFSGIGEVLQVLGVNKNTANTVERYFDNPFSALLLDLNTDNQIGNVFGLDKATMDSILKGVGDVAQGFVPVYGQARALASLLAKAARNEPLSDQETRDLADGLALKPNSLARKNLPEVKAPKNNVVLSPKNSTETSVTVEREEPTTPVTPPASETASGSVDAPNRLRPSQWKDLRNYAVEDGEKLISGAKPNASGIFQVKGKSGEDRWLIRLTGSHGESRIHEIDGRFKLSNGYAQVIDPFTQKPVMTVHLNVQGEWVPVLGPGGIKFPWQSGSAAASKFEPGAYDYPAEGQASSSKTTEKVDQRLKTDANKFHKTAKTKPRPALPELAKNASPKDVIDTVYKKSSGMIIGEDHSQPAGLQFLIDHAGEFKKNNVTTLYSEGFDHTLQPDLDHFFETGEFSPALRKNLKLIDRSHAGHGRYTNRELLLTMREHGIRVKAIDVPSVEPKATRLKNMNYYASNVIENDQAINPQGKWIARVGSDHVFTYDAEPPVRGISQLTGATGITVDNAPATSVIQSPDKTEIYIDLKHP